MGKLERVRHWARLVSRALLAPVVVIAFVAMTPLSAFAFGSGNAAWSNYYAHPSETSTWGPFCAGGGASVVASGLGVPSCGPTGTTSIYLPGGEYTPGFQCVELSERYLYVARGWDGLKADGAQVAKVYAAAHHVPLITNGTSGVAPHVGDVMSFSYTSNFSDTGHTAVVIASSVNGSGNGSITILSENAPADRSFTVSGWRVASVFGYPYSEWVQTGTGIENGAFVSYAGNVYRIAGGAPIYVSSWTPFGGPKPTTALTAAQFDALPQHPANGTAVYDADPGAGGSGYVFAGGAPLAVAKWSNVGNPSLIGVDGYSLNHYAATGPLSHVLQYPANGTAVWDETPDAGHGSGYVFAGGAPTVVRNWANVGSPHITGVDDAALQTYQATGAYSHVRQYPADGTFLAPSTGGTYRVAGGFPFHLADCTLVPCPGAVLIDGWGLTNPTNPPHFTTVPVNGTVVEGLPSGDDWSFTNGQRTEVGASSTAVAVDDTSLTGFPIAIRVSTASLPSGTVGRRYSATLAATGGTAPYSWSLTAGNLPSGLTLEGTGVISGRAKVAGRASFTVKVTDAKGTSATRALSITIS